MFSRVASFVVLSLPLFVAAGAITRRGGGACDVGTLQCCQQVQQANHLDGRTTGILESFGVNVGDLTGMVGATCDPITGIGASGTDCNAQPVCCEGNNFNGLVVIGCTPINVNA
ncbi:hypothetical protein AX17_006792 [Amanita inopinata Kibby_2008]|nr:hypothetical protein AX17_006792 [Amanita inopinata Kibby_2008]